MRRKMQRIAILVFAAIWSCTLFVACSGKKKGEEAMALVDFIVEPLRYGTV